MAATRRIGLILPSSNVVLEPAAAACWSGLPYFSWHISRLRVGVVALEDASVAQFETEAMMAAAERLIDADVDGLCWAGTAGAWLGLDRERELAESLAEQARKPATTTMLALMDQLAERRIERVGLLTPFTPEVQAAIIANLGAAGVTVTAACALGLASSRAMADVPPETIVEAVPVLARDGAQAVLILCTNLPGWQVAAELERDLGLPVLDSAELTLAASMALLGLDPRSIPGSRAFTDWVGR